MLAVALAQADRASVQVLHALLELLHHHRLNARCGSESGEALIKERQCASASPCSRASVPGRREELAGVSYELEVHEHKRGTTPITAEVP